MAASRFLRYIPENPMQGPDVRAVQEQLRNLGFYHGLLSGIFDEETVNAVAEFQSARRLTPDGIVGPRTYAALWSGYVVGAVSEKPLITIDLAQRKLYYRRGAVQRTYDVAIGAPGTPTPVGHWVITQKAMHPGGPFGSRWMRLNVPWGGYGIHGTNDDSSIGQAVSHGCVRLHNRDVEELYDLVPIGTEVDIVGTAASRVLTPGQADGPEVAAVQEMLQALGLYHGDPDGSYGPATAEAVKRLQAGRRLVADGVVGPTTYHALVAASDQIRGATEP